MKRETPPRAARWMLEHWKAGADREALAGDLLEEFRAGRGAGWYWRQAMAAVAIGFAHELWARRLVAAFALLYCVPMPWLWLCGLVYAAHAEWMGRLWAMPWPWSTICVMAASLGPVVIAVWVGMAVYALLHSVITRPQRRLRMGRGLWVSAAAWVVLTVGATAAVEAIASFRGGINTETVTVGFGIWSLIGALVRNPTFLVMQAPQFLALIAGIWAAVPREQRKVVAA
jgi:hypothetical protein